MKNDGVRVMPVDSYCRHYWNMRTGGTGHVRRGDVVAPFAARRPWSTPYVDKNIFRSKHESEHK